MNKTKEKSLPKTVGSHAKKSWHRNRIIFTDGTYYPINSDIIPSDILTWDLFNKSLCDKYKGMEINHV
jgi:hypothetical protein